MSCPRRVPFHWEDQEPVTTDAVTDYADVVLVPETFGEMGGRSPRDVREQMAADIARNVTRGSDAGHKWARQKAENALRNWDRGVQSGSIKAPRS